MGTARYDVKEGVEVSAPVDAGDDRDDDQVVDHGVEMIDVSRAGTVRYDVREDVKVSAPADALADAGDDRDDD